MDRRATTISGIRVRRVQLGGLAPFTFWETIGRIRSAAEGDDTPKPAMDLAQDDNWDVEWDAELRRFHFKNRLTSESRLAYLDSEDPWYIGWRKSKPLSSPADNPPPSQGDLLEALAYALRFGYSAAVFTQLLAYGVELNHSILQYADLPDTHIIPAAPEKISLTPLEWAVEHHRLDLVELFLGAQGGADANYSIWAARGPALRRAAYRGDQSIVEALYPKTDRVSRTRALSAAAERGDTATAALLLDLGCPYDFAESDRPLPVDPYAEVECPGPVIPPLQPKDLYPPLVVAIWRGDAAMVRVLLSRGGGADPNLAYHGLEARRRERYEEEDLLPMHEEPFFSCGRPAQLAMELGHGEIVGLLLEAGADVELPHGYWTARPPGKLDTLRTGHVCPLVPRKVYLAVTAGLREAAKSRGAVERRG
ncbi:kinase-like domain-containing protein [Apiospora saccharicola]